MPNNLPQEAERLAELGYPVFPCFDPRTDPSTPGKRGKIPLVQGGVSSATTDLGQVAEWWSRWPTANIGLACQNCLVFDLDTNGDKDGSSDLTRIADSLGPLESNMLTSTGSGGFHLYFKRPNDDIIGRAKVVWQGEQTGIDIRVGKQYAIAPPSLHELGKHYEWIKPPVPPRFHTASRYAAGWPAARIHAQGNRCTATPHRKTRTTPRRRVR